MEESRGPKVRRGWPCDWSDYPDWLLRRRFKAKPFECRRIVRAAGRIENFDSDDPPLVIVINSDPVPAPRAVLERTVGQVQINGVRRMIHSHAHGLVLSK